MNTKPRKTAEKHAPTVRKTMGGTVAKQQPDTTMTDNNADDSTETTDNNDTPTVNVETVPSVGPSLIGDLLTDKLDSWSVVICKIEKDDDDLLVCDENGQVVERVDTDVWTTTALSETEVKDLAKIADAINSAIASEYDDLDDSHN
jgi:hypothetical protein